jgi:hypothetical protein
MEGQEALLDWALLRMGLTGVVLLKHVLGFGLCFSLFVLMGLGWVLSVSSRGLAVARSQHLPALRVCALYLSMFAAVMNNRRLQLAPTAADRTSPGTHWCAGAAGSAGV